MSNEYEERNMEIINQLAREFNKISEMQDLICEKVNNDHIIDDLINAIYSIIRLNKEQSNAYAFSQINSVRRHYEKELKRRRK